MLFKHILLQASAPLSVTHVNAVFYVDAPHAVVFPGHNFALRGASVPHFEAHI